MEQNPQTYFIFLSAALGLLIGILLVFFSWKNSHHKHLLGVSMLCYALVCFVIALRQSGLIFAVPWIFRFEMPTLYLVAPTSYLYVRATIRNETHFLRYDWLHFIPVAVLVCEYIPYYFQPVDVKIRDIKYFIAHGADIDYLKGGILNIRTHIFIGLGSTLVYVLYQWKLISNFIRQAKPQLKKEDAYMIRWLRLYTLLIVCTYFVIVLVRVSELENAQNITNWLISLHLLITSLMLLFHPGILYGFKNILPPPTALLIRDDTILELPPEPDVQLVLYDGNKREAYLAKLDKVLLTERPYLNKGYTIKNLAEHTDIPVNHLSCLINKEFNMNFSNFINHHRIEYVKSQFETEEWRYLSLEGIAWKAGFTSRSTFFRAFVKHTGKSPSSYLGL
ncbi:helix-turn-helix domain-containing protein [Pedobacter polysacchareus]|uniref:helix-turn-helix domain-containing protein n=1 Tax=Pedobacter polysacchareus TaxID=2861973 RepID=UPI001C99E4D1|nr:helix-turn-helix domain-containing protein [Pedobacter polysacchareus]